jgi:hypothetical protein
MTELDDILEHLRRIRSESLETIELLRASRQKAEEQSRQLESPKAVYEYLDYFIKMFDDGAAELETVIAELHDGPRSDHVERLRQLASNSAAEQRRCLIFRDKWINRPLPYEQVRSLLNQISVDSRDQLTAYRSLTHAADRLQPLIGAPSPPSDQPPQAPDSDKLDRRALFTKWFGK